MHQALCQALDTKYPFNAYNYSVKWKLIVITSILLGEKFLEKLSNLLIIPFI